MCSVWCSDVFCCWAITLGALACALGASVVCIRIVFVRFSLWVMQCALLFPRSFAAFLLVLSPALLVVFAMASWRSKLVEQGVQESVADAIIKLGYDTEELFRSAFIDQAAFEGWLAKLRSKLGNTEWAALDAEDWATHPAAALGC